MRHLLHSSEQNPFAVASRYTVPLLTAGLLLSAPSCQSASQFVQRKLHPSAAEVAAETTEPARQVVPSQPKMTEIEKASAARLSVDKSVFEKSLFETTASTASTEPPAGQEQTVPERVAAATVTLDASAAPEQAKPFPDPFAPSQASGSESQLASRPASDFPKPEDRFQTSSPASGADVADWKQNPLAEPPIQQVAAKVARPVPEEFAADSLAAEPREPLPEVKTAANDPFAVFGPVPGALDCPPCQTAAHPFPTPEFMGDELVCDGGDKGEPVHYQHGERLGLNTEDTIAEFADETGKQHLVPSTETCLYAPRFASVRSTTLSQHEHSIDKAAGHQDMNAAARLDTRLVLDEKRHVDPAVAMQMRSRASGLETRQADDNIGQTVKHESHIKLTNSFEDYQFLSEGRFDWVTQAQIGQAIDAAGEWSDGRLAVILAQDAAGHLLQARQMAEDITGTPEKTPGTLKLVKVADKGHAHPGDTVTFTIRFDNTGDTELFGVRIVDNLSPRLAYVDGSIRSNLDGEILVHDNGTGGKLLTIEFDEPLPGRSGGYITFECTVR